MVILNRKLLLNTLQRIAPALSEKEFIPVLSNFCFDVEEGIAYTYNDVMALAVYSKELSELDCAIGKSFLKLLSTYTAEEVSFCFEEAQTDEKLLMKCGKSKVKLPYLLPDVFIFEPETEGEADLTFELTQEFIDGLKTVAPFMEEDVLHAMTLGVSVSVVAGSFIKLLVTDNRTVTEYLVEDGSQETDIAFLLPKFFCEALINWWKDLQVQDEPVIMNVYESHIKVEFEEGFIYTKLPYKAEPEVLEAVISKYLPESFSYKENAVAVSRELLEVINRTQMIKLTSNDKNITMCFGNTSVIVSCNTEGVADLVEAAMLENRNRIQSNNFYIAVDLLHKALITIKGAELLVLDRCFVLFTDSIVHLINITQQNEG